jgi:CHAD domain-containing protein
MNEPDGPTLHAVPYTEDDKLGPLGERRMVIDDEVELRRVLVAEFRRAADAARVAAGNVDRSATQAVHDYRKALRRARAILALVAAGLPRGERRAVRRALRDARRALGTVRDHAVAPSTAELLQLGEVETGTLQAILAQGGDAMAPPSDVKQLLAEGAARTAAQVEALEAALPPTVRWRDVLRGVREVYADARRARKDARRSKRAFHTWRRRTKELTYQLDVLGGFTGSKVGDVQRDLEAVADSQRPVVDLIMLRDYVRAHAGALAPEALAGLVDAIDAHIRDLMSDARRAGRDAFTKKPRRYARRLAKAARREASPPADNAVDVA